jgi:hypothetical protein
MDEARSNEELERLAKQVANLDLEDSEDRRRYFELIGPLTREEVLRLSEIHQRRGHGKFE